MNKLKLIDIFSFSGKVLQYILLTLHNNIYAAQNDCYMSCFVCGSSVVKQLKGKIKVPFFNLIYPSYVFLLIQSMRECFY
jgi:hypothetical protein